MGAPVGQAFPEFDVGQDTLDLMLLAKLSDHLGIQATSSVVCFADMIGGAEVYASKSVAQKMHDRAAGRLRPDLMAMGDEEFAEHTWQRARWTAGNLAAQAEVDLEDALDGVSVQEQGVLTRQLLTILGVSQAGNVFLPTARDDVRASKIVEVAKQMDAGYRQFVADNPHFQ